MADYPGNRPLAPASDFVTCLQQEDLGEKPGKQALNALMITHPAVMLEQFKSRRDFYRRDQGLSVGKANLMAAIEIVEELPGAEEFDFELQGLKVGKSVSGVVTAKLAEPAPDPAAKRKKAPSDDAAFDKLRSAVRARDRKGETTGGLPEAVSWVASHISDPLDEIDPDEVPNCEALNQLRFARKNEAEWRRSYDCKRVPAKGFASDTERGFVDDGEPVREVYFRIKAEMAPAPPKTETPQNDEQVRDLPAEQGGGDNAAVEEVDDGRLPAAVLGGAS